MKTPIKNFAHALSNDDYENLFAQYPEQAFAEDVQRYEARKAESDPDVSIHYFRIARIMRDLLFTCSSIDFGYEMARQSREKKGFAGVYHYALNQSMVAPLFRAAGMPWLGTVHGSDLDYLYNNIFPREHLSDETASSRTRCFFISLTSHIQADLAAKVALLGLSLSRARMNYERNLRAHSIFR